MDFHEWKLLLSPNALCACEQILCIESFIMFSLEGASLLVVVVLYLIVSSPVL